MTTNKKAAWAGTRTASKTASQNSYSTHKAGEFNDAMQADGLVSPEPIEPGKFYRFPGADKSASNKAGWCKLFDDGLGGVYGDYSTGLSTSWQAKRETPYSQAEREAFKRQIAEAKRQREAEEKERHEEAAIEAARLWNEAKPAPENHPYLIRKGIRANGARLNDGRLVIPLRSAGAVQSLQFIGEDGEKRFLPGGQVTGCYFSIGNPAGASALCIAEGFATGASIHETTGYPVAVAFNAGNMGEVSKAMRAKFPELPLILCADDDFRTKGNPGITAATEAARSVGGRVAVPDFGTDRPEGATDFNDMAQLCGAEAVKKAVASAKAPEKAEPSTMEENPQLEDTTRKVEIIRGCDINPEAISWLWDGWLARGKMHILGGAPGAGKTTIAMSLSATVTIGGRWPDGTRSELGNVVIWSGEDDPGDTLIPRLALSGADLERIYFVSGITENGDKRAFDPAKDSELLRRRLAEIGDVCLLVVDPIVSAVQGDSHKNAEVRRGLQPLVGLAASMRCALLGITHFSKGTTGRDPVERITGSLAFGALARVVLVAAKHQSENEAGKSVRVMLRAKSNIGSDSGGFEYDLQQGEIKDFPGVFASAVLWGEAIDGTARELLAEADSSDEDEEGGTLADVKRFLSDLLSDGPMKAGEVFRDADGAGYSKRSIQRAANKIGVERHKDGMRGGWLWKLPPKMPTFTEDAVDASLKSLAPLAPSAESSVVEVEL